MKKYGKIFMNGIIDENPTFRMVLGMCPTLAITTAASNGIGMGLAVTFVLIFSNLVISLLRKAIPDQIRIPAFIVVIATFVTIVQLIIKAFLPALDASLGVFIPLIVVNCIIIGRAEAFCQKNPIGPSFFDGVFQGLGYTCVLIVMCVVRELLGSGTFGGGLIDIANGFRFTLDGTGAGIQIFNPEYGATILVLPFGGFLTLGVLIAVMQYALKKSAKKKQLAEEAAAAEKKEEDE